MGANRRNHEMPHQADGDDEQDDEHGKCRGDDDMARDGEEIGNMPSMLATRTKEDGEHQGKNFIPSAHHLAHHVVDEIVPDLPTDWRPRARARAWRSGMSTVQTSATINSMKTEALVKLNCTPPIRNSGAMTWIWN